MSQVSDAVLRWLYNSLKAEYHDVERTYSDVADVLSRYPSLSPRTEVHTFENGSSALLLLLNGIIPVAFRGATYRYPLSLWIPLAYPHEPPLIYITPTPEMTVRAGQHVSIEGRVYHPYLADWASRWNEFNIVNLLSILANVFSKDPPVVARQGAPEQTLGGTRSSSGPPPPSRPGQGDGLRSAGYAQASTQSPVQSRAPPPPPKPSEAFRQESRFGQGHDGSTIGSGVAAPPLPPKRESSLTSSTGMISGQQQPQRFTPRLSSLALHQNRSQMNGPPLPPLPYEAPRRPPGPLQDGRGEPPYNDTRQPPPLHSPAPLQQWHQPPPDHARNDLQQQQPMRPYSQARPLQHQQMPQGRPLPQATSQFPQQFSQQAQASAMKPLQIQSKQPVPDLLSSPDDVTSPTTNTQLPAPPIPSNPEKDALLSNISSQLISLLSKTITQNYSAVPALQAQQAAMQRFQQSLTAELGALQQLDATLASDEQILRDAIREAEKMEKGLSRRELPGVDEVLVAPTVVGEQLYQLIAEERGIADAIFVLQRALEKDRVTGEVFIKQTRGLAREQFLKKALIRKISTGMGLATGEFH